MPEGAMRVMVLTLIAMGGCMGSGVPIDPPASANSQALSPVACRLELENPFFADVTTPDAHCMASADGHSVTVEWGAADAPWSLSASLDDPGVSWEGKPCESAHVDQGAGEITFSGMLYNALVNGTITIGN